ncbi:hypothetical protein FGIG_06049, partial [Fasciola gigantica]
DKLPEQLAQLVSKLNPVNHLFGALPKGSSAGLACRSLSTAYSLRHTGTRLNRVKATIRAATQAALNAHKLTSGDPSCNAQALRNQGRTVTVHPPKQCVVVKLESCPRTTRSVSAAQPRRTTMCLRSTPSVESIPVMGSVSASLCCPSPTGIHSPRRSKPSAAPLSDLSSVSAPKEIDKMESALDHCASPAPPQLDRASSVDSVSMPSQLSTAATTPDPQSGYYHGIIESHSNFSMPTLRVGLQCDGVSCIEYPSRNSSGDTSCTSPACTVEPILDRLLNETRSLELSFTNSNSSTPVKRPAKRLTNYDARLIAEANLFPPVPSRRRRSPKNSRLENSFIDSSRDNSMRTPRSLRSSYQSFASDRSSPVRARSSRLAAVHRTSSNEAGDAVSSYSRRYSKRRRSQLVDRSNEPCSTYRELESPRCLSSKPANSRAPYIAETVPDSTFEMASEPPQIYPFLVHESDEELVAAHTECGDQYFVPGIDQSCSTTPLRTDPMDDSDLSGDPAGVSHTCSFASYATEPMEFVYSDHDYTKHVAHVMKNADQTVCSLPLSSPCRVEYSASSDNYFLTSTPPPPILHPATPPGLDRHEPIASPILQRSLWPSCDHSLFAQVTPNSCPPKSAAFWALSASSARVKSSHEHLIPFEPRLTVTLKRIGPQSYQISQPDEVYVSQ